MSDAVESGLGRKLAILAKLSGKTQEEIARECKMSRISVNRFFRQHTEIRAGDLRKMLMTLGVDLDSIVDKAIEKKMRGGQVVTDPSVNDLSSAIQDMDDLTRKALVEQIRFWSRQLRGGIEHRASDILLAAVK